MRLRDLYAGLAPLVGAIVARRSDPRETAGRWCWLEIKFLRFGGDEDDQVALWGSAPSIRLIGYQQHRRQVTTTPRTPTYFY